MERNWSLIKFYYDDNLKKIFKMLLKDDAYHLHLVIPNGTCTRESKSSPYFKF